MSNIKANVSTVVVKAQGTTQTVDLSTFHSDTIDAILTYGTRRWFQDNINSIAKTLRDNNEPVDAAALFAARLEQAMTGQITMRNGTPTDPLDTYRIAALREHMKADPNGELKKAHDAIVDKESSVQSRERRAFLLSVAAKYAKAVDKRANELRKLDEKIAESAAAFDIAI